MMIQHVVLFKLQESMTPNGKKELVRQIKREFELLPEKIVELRALSILPNLNPNEEYDFMLVAMLESEKDLECYANHPEHISLVTKLIKPNLDKRAAVDVWVE
ncbi:MAG: Dabb family protein [Porphyromonas sp.]|nr:Dabb family protein [Porphyromonas sp.]